MRPAATLGTARVRAGLDPFRPGIDGPWDRDAAWHLLRRGGFGPLAGSAGDSPDTVGAALERGLEATLLQLFDPAGHDPELVSSIRHLLAGGQIETLQAWWMALILAGGDPLRERMTLAWHDHFATSNDKVGDVRLMHRQNELLRQHALGDFRELMRAVAIDPAMLAWLDGDENRRGRPNENFAREVMELFGLGIGNYTESDVSEAARAFTGWGTRGRSFHFRAEHHDPGVKTIFGRSGRFSGEEAIELVLEHPACPRWVARRLLTEFVSESPTEAEIESVAEILLEANWDIGATVRQLLASRLFFAASNRRARIASPVELVVSTVRALDAPVAPAAAAEATTRMGQALFRPSSVKGWDGGRSWIDAGTWLARHNTLAKLAAAHGQGAGDPQDRDEVVDAVLRALLPAEPGADFKGTLEAEAQNAPDVDDALRRVVALVLTAPEYHLT